MSRTKKTTAASTIIRTKEDFLKFIETVNNGENRASAELETDLDFLTPDNGKVRALNTIQGVYYGVFDGKGHTISGNLSSSLFRNNHGTICNLTIVGEVIGRAAFADVNNGHITNCVNKATIKPQNGELAAGIVFENRTKGKIDASCRNLGEIRMNYLAYLPVSIPLSQICCLRITNKTNGTKGTVCENFSSPMPQQQEKGKFLFYDGNSLMGFVLQSAYKTFFDNSSHFYYFNSPEYRERMINLLKLDKDILHINDRGQNYLHILCSNSSFYVWRPLNYYATALLDYFSEIVLLLAAEPGINFSLRDKDGKQPKDYLMKNGKARYGFGKILKAIQDIAREQARDKKEADDPIDPFGF